MQQLLGDHPGVTDGSFLKELFLQSLPSNVRMVLTSTPEGTSLEKLVNLADKIMEVATPSVATITTPTALATEVEQLRGEVSQLSKLVQKLVRSRSSSRPSRRSPIPTTPSDPVESLCWYHQHYGDQAKKCKPPVPWRQTRRPATDSD